MKKMPGHQIAPSLACFGGGDQSELIREIDLTWEGGREVNQEGTNKD